MRPAAEITPQISGGHEISGAAEGGVFKIISKDGNDVTAFEREFPLGADGKAKVTSEGISEGTYKMQISYSGDEKYSENDNIYEKPITITKTPDKSKNCGNFNLPQFFDFYSLRTPRMCIPRSSAKSYVSRSR